jgi:hypothetical protein
LHTLARPRENYPEGSEYSARLSSGVSQALARLRDLDPDARDAVRAELLQCAETLDAAARGGMAALLQVRPAGARGSVGAGAISSTGGGRDGVPFEECVRHATVVNMRRSRPCRHPRTPPQGPAFDTDARRAQGPVLHWIDRLFRASPTSAASAAAAAAGRRHDAGKGGAAAAGGGGGGPGGAGAGPPRAHVARVALGHLLRFNLDMFSVCVDRCYHPDPSIATGYFQVRAAAAAGRAPVGRSVPAGRCRRPLPLLCWLRGPA